MMDYIEFLELPEFVAMALIILFLVMQVVGEILDDFPKFLLGPMFYKKRC